jgi:hypothetical protein
MRIKKKLKKAIFLFIGFLVTKDNGFNDQGFAGLQKIDKIADKN